MTIPKSFFPVGATYAPLPKATEVDIAEWPEDIENMAKLGFNTFRLFICHDRVEKEEGVLDFSAIDRAFELAEKNNMKVLVNIGGTFANLQGVYAPRHLAYKGYTLVEPTPGCNTEIGANRLYLCCDDPQTVEASLAFIRIAVKRYSKHPALLAWSGWNEPHLNECFCHHTVELFRNYLKEKYSSLEALAKAWGTEFPIHFRDWSDVHPQVRSGFRDGGYVPYLDWRRFLNDNLRDKFNLIRNTIREIDPVRPVMSHIISPGYADTFGEEDIIGTSIYTIHAQRKSITGFSEYMFTLRQHVYLLAQGQRANRRDPEGFWVIETEAGPVSWVHDLIPRGYTPRQMNARDILFVAHGARALLRWLYRSRISDAQAGEFNMVGWDGRITDRAEVFGEIADFLNSRTDLFLSHIDEPSGVWILDQRRGSLDLNIAEGYETRYEDAMRNLYSGLLHIGVRPRFCNARQLDEGIPEEVKVIFFPFCPYVDPKTAAELERFVENGGCIIAESPFAIKNNDAIHYRVTPGKMEHLFGACVFGLEALKSGRCGNLPAFDFRAEMEATAGTVEAKFPEGGPAIISNSFGKGKTVLYGSQISMAYMIESPFYPSDVPVISYEEGGAFRSELKQRLAAAGVPAWELTPTVPEDTKYIQVIPRQLPDGKKLLFVLNMSSQAKEFQLSFPEAQYRETVGKSSSADRLELTNKRWKMHLEEWGWAVLSE